MVFLFLLLAFCESQRLYAVRNLQDKTRDTLLSTGHFFGTYGKELSVVSDPQESIAETLEVVGAAPYTLYVFELRTGSQGVEGVTQVKRYLSSFSNLKIVYTSTTECIIQALPSSSSQQPDFTLTAAIRRTFPLLENIISIPSRPYLPRPTQKNIYPTVTAPDPKIQALLTHVTTSSLNASIVKLANFTTRNSFSTQVKEAADWIAAELRNLTFNVPNVTLVTFNSSYGPNVIATFRGTVNSPIIILGAHYDSRSTNVNSTTQVAPGAIDNGSGSAALIEVAKAINRGRAQFRYPVQLQFFCGEEQGLVGSRYQARQVNASTVRAMLNADMLGYALPNATSFFTQGFKDRYISRSLTDLAMNVTREYTTLRTANSSSCCSDYQSYYEVGVDAVGFFQNQGGASDYPAYHTSDDLPKWVNWTQQTLETQAFTAMMATIAEII